MKKKVIGITTGDIDGIGLEVTMKALRSFKSSRAIYLVWQPPTTKAVGWKSLPKEMSLYVPSLDDALTEAHAARSRYRFIHIESTESPALWVRQATLLCLNKTLAGMVTGPVSKKTFLDANLGSVGHTPLLKDLCKTQAAYMGFLGAKFNVVLLSGHIPTASVERSLTADTLSLGFQTISEWTKRLPKSLCAKPIGVLGLNPHNGEGRLIGDYELDVLIPTLRKFKRFRGPLVPDAAFLKENWDKYSFYVSLYHDQGLIPFKMIHGHSGGAHVTLGLPITRTSVDHGTASDIFGKGIARAESMRDAIQWCETLISKKG